MGGGRLEREAGRGAGDQDILIFWGSINLTIICARLFLLFLHMHAVVGDSVDKQRLLTSHFHPSVDSWRFSPLWKSEWPGGSLEYAEPAACS